MKSFGYCSLVLLSGPAHSSASIDSIAFLLSSSLLLHIHLAPFYTPLLPFFALSLHAMPSHTLHLEDSLAKKGGLTLARLIDYDDHITDALVDRVSTRRVQSLAHCHLPLPLAGVLLDHHP